MMKLYFSCIKHLHSKYSLFKLSKEVVQSKNRWNWQYVHLTLKVNLQSSTKRHLFNKYVVNLVETTSSPKKIYCEVLMGRKQLWDDSQ